MYASALIKKRRYWPKHVDGDGIAAHFADKNVGDVDMMTGKLDDVELAILGMKEPEYVMSLMTLYGTSERFGEEKTRIYDDNGSEKRVSFKYPEIVRNHYLYRHAVDDHNGKRHAPISVEETWGTKWWPNRVFAFLLAVTEVNMNLAERHFFGGEEQPMLEFRKQLAKAMMKNDYVGPKATARRSRRLGKHILLSLAKFEKFHKGRKVRSQSEYPQATCSECKKKVRSYCSCSPGILFCKDCHVKHVIESI